MDRADRVGVQNYGTIQNIRTYSTAPISPRCKIFYYCFKTFRRTRLLDEKAKERLLSSLLKSCEIHGWKLEDWVILDNHYHIMVAAPEDKTSLSTFVAEYHKFTALFIKRNNPAAESLPKIFNNYWYTCISYESSYYARLNYIYYNPVKHGYVQHAQDYQWGSFSIRYCGEKPYIEKLAKAFPFDEVKIEDDY